MGRRPGEVVSSRGTVWWPRSAVRRSSFRRLRGRVHCPLRESLERLAARCFRSPLPLGIRGDRAIFGSSELARGFAPPRPMSYRVPRRRGVALGLSDPKKPKKQAISVS